MMATAALDSRTVQTHTGRPRMVSVFSYIDFTRREILLPDECYELIEFTVQWTLPFVHAVRRVFSDVKLLKLHIHWELRMPVRYT